MDKVLDDEGSTPITTRLDQIIVGGTLSLSGRYADVGKRMEQGYRLWEADTAAQGGILGKQIGLVILDDESDPKRGAQLYEKLIEQQKIDLVLSPYGSEITDVMASVTERHGYPLVAAGALAPEIWEQGRRYIVGLPKTARHFLEGAIDLAANRGFRRIAIIGEDSIFTTSNAKGAAALAQQRGLEVVLYDLFPKGAPDFTALLSKARDLETDALLVYAFLADSIAITRRLKELNINLKLLALTAGVLLPEYIKALGPLSEYVLGPTPWEPVELGYPGAALFIERFKSRFGSLPSGHNINAYASLVILEKAIRIARSFDRDSIREALFKLHDHNLYGDYAVNPETGEQIGKTMLMFQIQKGVRRVIWPETVREVEPILPPPAWNSR